MWKRWVCLGISTAIFLCAIMFVNTYVFQNMMQIDVLNKETLLLMVKICSGETIAALIFLNAVEYFFTRDIDKAVQQKPNDEKEGS